MKDYAELYYNLGLNPTCISYIKTKYNSKENNPEKSPSHSWKKWQVRRPTFSEVNDLNWKVSNGIGTVLGHSSRCIDIDGCDSYEFITKLLSILRLPENYQWVVKTPNGFHIHITCAPIYFATYEQLVNGVLSVDPNEKSEIYFKKIELRWANHSVLPPTIINGKKYHFTNDSFPTNPPARVQMLNVFRALCEFCGRSANGSGNFISKNMIFQLAVPSEGYATAEAIIGSINDQNVKDATYESGYINYEKLPKKIQAGYIEIDYSYFIRNTIPPPFFIDLETTGLIKDEFDYENYPRIIQIAYKHKGETKVIYIKPDDFQISPDIERLTGISTNLLIQNGIGIREALMSIDKEEGSPIIGYNIDFDLAVFDSEYLRLVNKPNSTFVMNKLRDGCTTTLIGSRVFRDEIVSMLGHSNRIVTEHYLASLNIEKTHQINAGLF
jgi:hypothetical protein